jgi:3-dehydroquinate synthase II
VIPPPTRLEAEPIVGRTGLKEAWVCLEEWSKAMVTTALEGGADALVVPSGWQERVNALGRIATVSPDGDLKPGVDVFFEILASPEDERRIADLLQQGPVVLEPHQSAGRERDPLLAEGTAHPAATQNTSGANAEPGAHPGWPVIPLENLVARGGRLLVPVSSLEGVDLALGILETGVAGVVIHARYPEELKNLLARVKAVSENQPLQTAIIDSIRPVGMGDRVCIDTCTLMVEGEGVLVGNSSGFLFLVQAEVKSNPYVAPRPFRVNAGPVHAYVKVPGERTRYLSELRAGDSVLVVHARGRTQTATVGRCKIERRPLLLVEASYEGSKGSLLLQNAETIRLTSPDGTARSVVELQAGDQVLVRVEKPGRHFGMKITETIVEH